MSLELFLLRMPKVELHVHLEGSMRPPCCWSWRGATASTLPAERRGGAPQLVPLPRLRALRPGLPHLLARAARARGLPAAGARLPGRAGAPERRLHRGPLHDLHPSRERRATAASSSPPWRRRSGRGERLRRPAAADPRHRPQRRPGGRRTARWSGPSPAAGAGVVALGLSGSEARFPNEPFREHFAAAGREGLHRVAHAGEHAGPESIRSVLEVCGAERIGHGVRAVEDPVAGRRARDRRHPAGGLPDLQRLPGRRPRPREPPLRPALPERRAASRSIPTTRPSSARPHPTSTCACTAPSATAPPSWPASPSPACGSPSCRTRRRPGWRSSTGLI